MVTPATQASKESLLFLHKKKTCTVRTLNTSKTPAGWSATFKAQGLGVFFSFVFLSYFWMCLMCFLIVSFFDLNCCTISCNISSKKKFFEPSREVPLGGHFFFFILWFSCLFLLFLKKHFFHLIFHFFLNFMISSFFDFVFFTMFSLAFLFIFPHLFLRFCSRSSFFKGLYIRASQR